MKRVKNILCGIIGAVLICLCMVAAIGCSGCNSCGGHRHTYAAEWSRDEVNHWHDATCGHSDEKADLGTHRDVNNDEKCDICGANLAQKSETPNVLDTGNRDENPPPEFGRVFEAAASRFAVGTKLKEYREGVKYGLYAETATDTDYFAATERGFEQKLGTAGNKGVYISLELLKGNIEGSFEVSADKMGSKWDVIQIKSGGKTVFAVRTDDDGESFIKKFNGGTESVNFYVVPKAGTVYKVTYRLTAGKDGNYALTLKISGETFVENFSLGVKRVESIYLTSSNGGSDPAKARLLTIDNVIICGVEMTEDEYRRAVQTEIDDLYAEMTDTTVGTHTRNAAAIKSAHDAIDLSDINGTEALKQEVIRFRSLKTSIDSDEKISAAIDGFFADLEGVKSERAADYAINRRSFVALIAEYESADFTSAASVNEVANRFFEFEAELAKINTDKMEISAYAGGRHADIANYAAADLQELDDSDLEEVIADIKSAAIATLADGITERDGYADETSPDYYRTVIDARVAAVQGTIRAKINDAGRDIGDLKRDAEREYFEFVANEIDLISRNDGEFAAELAAEAPALDLDGCTKAGAIFKAIAAAKADFSLWLEEKLSSKEYDITVYATINGENSGSVTVKVRYGQALSLEDLPDPTAARDDYLIDPDDGRYYTEKPFDTDRTFDGTDGVYSNYTLYVKIVKAAWAPEERFTFSYSTLEREYGLRTEDDGAALPAGVMKGAGNGFLTIAPEEKGTVSWRNSTRGYIENKNDGLTVAFIASGKLIIKAASTGTYNVSRLGVRDSKGNWLSADKITGTAEKVVSGEESGSYSFTNTTEVTFEFVVPKAGVYTISCPSSVTGRGARIHSVVQVIDTRKVKAEGTTGATLYLIYLTSLTTTVVQTWDNGWKTDETLASQCRAYFKNSYGDFDIKYDNGTLDTSDDITPVIAKAESGTYIRFTLSKSAVVTVYYTYNEGGTKTKGFMVDNENTDWPAVAERGEVAAKSLGAMSAGEHVLERAGEIGFCYILVKEI